MLTVNVEETAGALVRDGMSPALARQTLDLLDLDFIDYTIPMEWRSVDLGPLLPRGLGFADRACLATASVIPVFTADTARPIGGVPLGIKVVAIR